MEFTSEILMFITCISQSTTGSERAPETEQCIVIQIWTAI